MIQTFLSRRACRLSAAFPKKHGFQRVEDNHHIERQALILDVIKVVLQLLYSVADRRPVRIFDLRPACLFYDQWQV